ncbi:MAG: 50S ribosomal protein L6 [Legionellaceae bacterium]|nr:50S ribosomal protein L6 [Legionellaceae bacterium]
MSRVGKAPIAIPAGVEVTVEETTVTVKGPKGMLSQRFNSAVSINADVQNVLTFSPAGTDPKGWAHTGTARAVVNNMIHGVTHGFTKTLELVGVGYRAQASGSNVSLSLGFSHPIDHVLPQGVKAETPSNTVIVLTSIDKDLLGKVAAKIRSYRPPEPYKGKGVLYAGEKIVRKEAKKK